MAQTYNKMKIDIKEPVTDIITAKQNDSNSRFLDVYLYDGGVPIDLTGHEVRIYMLKADGTEIFNNGTITEAASGRCQFELTDQALGAYGKLLCEISIWYDNVQILTTPTFDIFVVKNLRTNGSIESSNEYGALVVLYQNLYEAFDLITTMVEQFGEPGEVADAASIETFWQMLEYLYGANEAALKNASVQGVIDLIGATGNTGGSATAGTLMAKANAVIGYLLNDTYGLNALKALLDKSVNWHAENGTSITLKSTTSAVTLNDSGSSSNPTQSILAFVAPENGVYKITVNWKAVNNSENVFSGTPVTAGVKDCSDLILRSNVSYQEWLDVVEKDLGKIEKGASKTGSQTFTVFLEKGRAYAICVYCYLADTYNVSVTNANVKYSKVTS